MAKSREGMVFELRSGGAEEPMGVAEMIDEALVEICLEKFAGGSCPDTKVGDDGVTWKETFVPRL